MKAEHKTEVEGLTDEPEAQYASLQEENEQLNETLKAEREENESKLS